MIELVQEFTHEVGDTVRLDDGHSGRVESFYQSLAPNGATSFLVRSYKCLTLDGPFAGRTVVMSELKASNLPAPASKQSRFDKAGDLQ